METAQWGKTDVWHLHDLSENAVLDCDGPSQFLHMLFSRSTARAILRNTQPTPGVAELIIYGPITDDAILIGRAMPIKYDGERPYLVPEGEHKFEYTARLKTIYKLTRHDVDYMVTTAAEQDALMARLRRLGLGGLSCKWIADAFGWTDVIHRSENRTDGSNG